MGGNEVKSKLYNIKYIWSIITAPENPQNNWYQNSKKTNACNNKKQIYSHLKTCSVLGRLIKSIRININSLSEIYLKEFTLFTVFLKHATYYF